MFKQNTYFGCAKMRSSRRPRPRSIRLGSRPWQLLIVGCSALVIFAFVRSPAGGRLASHRRVASALPQRVGAAEASPRRLRGEEASPQRVSAAEASKDVSTDRAEPLRPPHVEQTDARTLESFPARSGHAERDREDESVSAKNLAARDGIKENLPANNLAERDGIKENLPANNLAERDGIKESFPANNLAARDGIKENLPANNLSARDGIKENLPANNLAARDGIKESFPATAEGRNNGSQTTPPSLYSPSLASLGERTCPGRRPYHVLLTASSGSYQLWQSRIFHHYYLRMKAEAGRCGEIGGLLLLYLVSLSVFLYLRMEAEASPCGALGCSAQ